MFLSPACPSPFQFWRKFCPYNAPFLIVTYVLKSASSLLEKVWEQTGGRGEPLGSGVNLPQGLPPSVMHFGLGVYLPCLLGVVLGASYKIHPLCALAWALPGLQLLHWSCGWGATGSHNLCPCQSPPAARG